jgi:hypothetical protein
MAWDVYERQLLREWQAFLPSTDDEKSIQQFLELHPCLVPGSRFPMTSSFPVRAALVTQPQLVGVTRRVPDFMWLSNDSATLYPVLIEIERPTKQWFTRKGVPRAPFNQAMSQLREWRAWFNEASNQALFMRQFDIPDDYNRGRFRPHGVLIYGRRAELHANPRLRRVRAMQEHPDETILSFDRLRPLPENANFLTIRRVGSGYAAVSVPPTLTLGPMYAPFWVDIQQKREAIERCEWMPAERKAFLRERIEYWDDWAKRGNHGIIHVGDEE